MHSLRLDVEHKQPEVRDEVSPTGSVRIERGEVGASLCITLDSLSPKALENLRALGYLE